MKSPSSLSGGGPGEPSEAQLDARQVEATYDRIAPFYDVWGRLTESKAWARALALAQARGNETILEVTPGTGLAFVELVRANPQGRIARGAIARRDAAPAHA